MTPKSSLIAFVSPCDLVETNLKEQARSDSLLTRCSRHHQLRAGSRGGTMLACRAWANHGLLQHALRVALFARWWTAPTSASAGAGSSGSAGRGVGVVGQTVPTSLKSIRRVFRSP